MGFPQKSIKLAEKSSPQLQKVSIVKTGVPVRLDLKENGPTSSRPQTFRISLGQPWKTRYDSDGLEGMVPVFGNK